VPYNCAPGDESAKKRKKEREREREREKEKEREREEEERETLLLKRIIKGAAAWAP